MDEAAGVFPKNAPETEIGKQKLTAEAKRKNRPEWMIQGAHHQLKKEKERQDPFTRSLYDIGTYRHNFNTGTQFA